MAISNTDIIKAITSKYPTFKGHTASDALKLVTEDGFNQISNIDPSYINDFFGLICRVWLNQITVSKAKNPLEDAGFGEFFDMPYGAYIQRMSVDSIKPINPAWNGLKDGDSVDPFVVRKPSVGERFWKVNFNYASMVTIPDDFQMKQIFVSENGLSEFMAGITTGLENGYKIQSYLMEKNAIGAQIAKCVTASKYITIKASADTSTFYKDLVKAVRKVVTTMKIAPQTGAYNLADFKSVQDPTRLKLLIRAGYVDDVAVDLMPNAFHVENLNMPVDIIQVPDFGDLEPYKEAEFTTKLYPVYDKLGSVVGFAETENATEATVTEDNVFWKDPHADVVAVLADKGAMFRMRQNPLQTEPIRNPRGRYTNIFVSEPNGAYCVDDTYNFVPFLSQAE